MLQIIQTRIDPIPISHISTTNILDPRNVFLYLVFFCTYLFALHAVVLLRGRRRLGVLALDANAETAVPEARKKKKATPIRRAGMNVATRTDEKNKPE
jgi:hypothetical protein